MAEQWWKSLYDDLLAKILLNSTSETDIKKTVLFLQKALDINPGELVLDQCCGTGRLSIAMSKLGHKLIGVDLIDSYIQEAKQQSISNSDCRFFCDDAFNFTSHEPVKAVFNWWTSFGYSESDSKNKQMLERAFESLEVGGKFALDFMNVPGLYRNFQPQVVTRINEPDGELTLIRESEIDHTTGILLKIWTYFLSDGRKVQHRSQVRLYSPHQLHELFAACGFENIQIFGDIDFSDIDLSSPRCIIIGRKPL
jgi:SAM-dependent methyltransferase